MKLRSSTLLGLLAFVLTGHKLGLDTSSNRNTVNANMPCQDVANTAETGKAPVEGEALAIAWSLEHTKFFIQGCDKLVIVTDHKPLIKLSSDLALDEITNSRLFSLKQRTLPWRFMIEYKAGRITCSQMPHRETRLILVLRKSPALR